MWLIRTKSLRKWARMSCGYGCLLLIIPGEVSLSENILKQRADAYRRIRNTCRFLLANLHDFDPATNQVAYEDMVELDRFAMASAFELQEKLETLYRNYEFHTIYQLLFNFCSVTMGGFYLDVIKDRQYTIATDANARRSAQTAIYHILEAMVRWLAPILSFTAEEIWQHLPGEREESVFLSTFYKGLRPLQGALSVADWQRLIEIRNDVNAELEVARNQGVIGGSLSAAVEIGAAQGDYDLLKKLGDELHFALIVSQASVVPATEFSVKVSRSEGEKCERCWHHLPDVGQHEAHPTLCGRCIENIDGAGEQREFV